MEQWIEIRRRVLNGELSKRAACAEYGIHWDTLKKILTHSEPPGYRLTKPRRSKLEPSCRSSMRFWRAPGRLIGSSDTRVRLPCLDAEFR